MKMSDNILEDVYFFKIGRIRYLMSNNSKKDCCQICGKRRKTTAHHIIPKRLRCVCPHLSEIRIRACSKCEEGLHPENKFIKESDVVERQSKKINHLQASIKDKDNKIRTLTNGLKALSNDASNIVNKDDKIDKKESAKPSVF